jgi:hypothetical protein
MSVTYNYGDQVWTTGTLARTSYADAHVFENPMATKFDIKHSSNITNYYKVFLMERLIYLIMR